MKLFLKASASIHPAAQGATHKRVPVLLTERGLRRNPGEPSAEESATGEYKKPAFKWRGLTMRVESPAGSIRRGRKTDGGVTFEIRMIFDYGEIEGTMGVDGDPVDFFMGPNTDAPFVYIVHQNRYRDWDNYDEDKCMIGFDSVDDAAAAFLSCYTDARFLGPITVMPVDEFCRKVIETVHNPVMIKAIGKAAEYADSVPPKVGSMLEFTNDRLTDKGPATAEVMEVKPTVDGWYLKLKFSDGSQQTMSWDDMRGGAEPGKNVWMIKSHVGAYMRGGKLVNLKGYEGRHAAGGAAPGQMSLFIAEPREELVKEHKRLVRVLESPNHADDKREADKQAAELQEYEGKPPGHPLHESGARLADMRRRADANDPKTADMLRKLAIPASEKAHAKLKQAFEAFDKHGDGTELSTEDGQRHAIFLPDASSPGKYRYQMFDANGFSAHSTHDTPEKAVADAVQSGYHVHNPGILDRLAGTEEWAHGMAISAVMQAHNSGQMSWSEAMDEIRRLNAERDAKREPPAQPPVAEAVDDHPAPTPRMQLSQVPEAQRPEWLRLHRQQHELHHYELGQTRERLARSRSKMRAAESRMREAEAGAKQFRANGLPGSEERALEFDAAAKRHKADFVRHRSEVDREVATHQNLYEQVAKLGRQKDAILPLSGEMSFDWPANRMRTAEEQQRHEKEQLAMYRSHYKAKDREAREAKRKPMVKAWDWSQAIPLGRPPLVFVKP